MIVEKQPGVAARSRYAQSNSELNRIRLISRIY